MKKDLLEIISSVIKEIRENSEEDVDLHFIVEMLIERGFSEEDISDAMVWLMHHEETIERYVKDRGTNLPRAVWRTLHETESEAISPEAFSYLFHLRELELLSDDDMELIIERAVSLKTPSLDVEEIQDLIALVILDFENSVLKGYFQFTANRLPH
ncbi:DUF494 family protein [candidate division KSB1 bacterium]|nr:DUF494 family protein [candidate division KSB1 bacterium]